MKHACDCKFTRYVYGLKCIWGVFPLRSVHNFAITLECPNRPTYFLIYKVSLKKSTFENVQVLDHYRLLVFSVQMWWFLRSAVLMSGQPESSERYLFLRETYHTTYWFLGPRGPLVLPLSVPSRAKNLDPMYTGIYASWIIRRLLKPTRWPNGIP